MTTPHTPPAALDVAAIEARAAERARRRRYAIVSSYHGLSVSPDGTVALIESDRTVTEYAGETPEADADLALALAALRTLAAQHAVDVTAAVAGERGRCIGVADAMRERNGKHWTRAQHTAVSAVAWEMRPTSAEGDALAAPAGGGE